MEEYSTNLENLEIVGGEFVRNKRLPHAPFPILKFKTPSDSYIVWSPNPYRDNEIVNYSYIKNMIRMKDIFLLDDPIQALPNHILWQDDNGNFKYEPLETVRQFFKKYSREKVSQASKAYYEFRNDDALELAQRAINADENCSEATRVMIGVWKRLRKFDFVNELEYLLLAQLKSERSPEYGPNI